METVTQYSKAKWATQLHVSTSGYYTWLKERKKRQEKQDVKRDKVVSLFHESKGTYGVERICGILRSRGESAAYPVVKRIMNQEGLRSCHVRKQRSLTNSKKSRGEGLKNLTKGLKIIKPFQVLSSDISYIKTGEGFDYVCQVRDVYTNTVLASSQEDNMKKEIVLKTIQFVKDRWALPEDVIFHSDRGSQYTSSEVMKKVKEYGWKQSFSRVGKPGDNSWSESFFSILKKEIVHWRFYKTREVARQAIFEYMEGFYNQDRLQKRFGYLSPMQFLKLHQKNVL
jgi:putative transposase